MRTPRAREFSVEELAALLWGAYRIGQHVGKKDRDTRTWPNGIREPSSVESTESIFRHCAKPAERAAFLSMARQIVARLGERRFDEVVRELDARRAARGGA